MFKKKQKDKEFVSINFTLKDEKNVAIDIDWNENVPDLVIKLLDAINNGRFFGKIKKYLDEKGEKGKYIANNIELKSNGESESAKVDPDEEAFIPSDMVSAYHFKNNMKED